jgi:hypothetical protein
MEKVITKEVKQKTQEIIKILTEDGFFETLEICTSTAFAEKYLNQVLTDKLINGLPLDLGDEREMDEHLDKIIGGSVCYDLKQKGFLDSYEDEDTPETFFVTEQGRKLQEQLSQDGTLKKE